MIPLDQRSYALHYYHTKRANDPIYKEKQDLKNKAKFLSPEGRMRNNLSRRKREALKKHPSMDVSITLEDLLPLPIICPILGVVLDYGKKDSYGPKHNSPSIDRINLNFGYTKGNVQIISQKANQIKSNGTAQEILLVAQYLGGLNVDTL